ncbi:hypothetical protein F511_17489 [Dorcoceras hygrometricum]|uniref:Uncharacterized protein n=1 Tax=Dorcoceras hygrometricum TaxID=472368 RepID=A0A2Z7AP24_9LAMI|nr:hypothetical protein F511_17489 [Dorcoceras hygrometricum]
MPSKSTSGPEDRALLHQPYLHHQRREQSSNAHGARAREFLTEALPHARESPELLRYGEKPYNLRSNLSSKASPEGPQPDVLKHFRKRRRTWAGLCGKRAHDLTHVLTERASKPIHLPNPSINTPQVCSFRLIHSHLHTLAHRYTCSHSLALTSPDLSIGGASPDTSPAPSDEVFCGCRSRPGARPSLKLPDVIKALRCSIVCSRLNYLATSDT